MGILHKLSHALETMTTLIQHGNLNFSAFGCLLENQKSYKSEKKYEPTLRKIENRNDIQTECQTHRQTEK